MYTHYQKYIAFLLLTSMLLQSCIPEIPNDQERRPDPTQHKTSINPPSEQSSVDSPKILRLIVKRDSTLQGAARYSRHTDFNDIEEGSYIRLEWQGAQSDAHTSSSNEASLNIITPSSTSSRSLVKSGDNEEGLCCSVNEFIIEENLPMFFEIKTPREQTSSPQIENIPPVHIVGLSTFKNPGYSLKLHTNSKLQKIISSDSDTSSVTIEKISEHTIEDLKRRVQTEGQELQTEERRGQTEGQELQTEEKGVQTEGQELQTEERRVQTEGQELQTEERRGQTEDACSNRSKWSTKSLLLYGSVCGSAGLASWLLIKKHAG